ncbi:phosphatidate cytidylyltransferase [Hoeflea sp. YIM 152468]|uniref:phosphatidate cytidylyltransferase n=1 Tax=Hoeflea sp. YIM 152468 TaxID=3031759 RepID=UPI0023DAF76B|nr:phosphatidate cytidylyltransferase [Hoeflea sp. YIM 152468]MDF1607334.1 phosphatidate cytidylyltransferase [Hoeflea sp. YIM 152468]
MSRELRLRIVSGVVLGIVVLVLTWAGGVWFRALAVSIMVLMHYEFSSMINAPAKAPLANAIGWLAILATSAFILTSQPSMALAAIVIGSCGAVLAGLARGGVWSATAVLYAGMAGLALAEIRGEGVFGLFAMMFLIAIVWATDILAYFCGRALGGPKLAPRISPGKTWSGAIFGTAAGVGAGLGVALAVRHGGGWMIPAVALVLSVASQIGDLFESWVKRRFGAKDSSQLIPGHGGVMDRVDGLVFAAFAAFLLGSLLPLADHAGVADELAARLLGL